MRQRIIYLAVLLILVPPCFGQFRTGLKGGANLSQVSMNINGIELDSYNPRTGVHVGFMAEYMFSSYLGLHGELAYFNSGANINPTQFKRWFDVGEDISLTGHLSMHTIQLPLYLKTRLILSPHIKLYLMGGGFVGYALKGEIFEKLSMPGENPLKLRWSLYEDRVHIFDRYETNIHLQERLHAGLAAEVGIEAESGITIGIGFRQVLYNLSGLTVSPSENILKTDIGMWTVGFSAGYWF